MVKGYIASLESSLTFRSSIKSLIQQGWQTFTNKRVIFKNNSYGEAQKNLDTKNITKYMLNFLDPSHTCAQCTNDLASLLYNKVLSFFLYKHQVITSMNMLGRVITVENLPGGLKRSSTVYTRHVVCPILVASC